jgi:enediyne biosynthesis protein E4
LRKTIQFCAGVCLLLAGAGAVLADGGVTFNNIAAGDGAGVTYRRAPSAERMAAYFDIVAGGPYPAGFTFFLAATAGGPMKFGGAPGVALFDYDGDGDLDIYVTNGPGRDNSLYSNQRVETGSVTFVDVAASAGVALRDHEGSGVCFGDTDNDGDQDLLVLGLGFPNHFFVNNGDGTFTDVTASSGLESPSDWSYIGCSMGDIDNDGLLDIAIATSYHPWTERTPVFRPGFFEGTDRNYLFRNNGGNSFVDVSHSSGFLNLIGPPDGRTDDWSIALVDIDQDGDMDAMISESTGPPPGNGGGYPRLVLNDGTGHFHDATFDAGLGQTGAHMGLNFADFNCDGLMDFFVTDVGVYVNPNGPSRWYLQNADGTFTSPGVGALGGTPFGWGVSAFDYDNDGDSDVIYHGGMEMGRSIILDNPGVLLRNDGLCTGTMSYDAGAVPQDHRPRAVEGVAVGDLDGDGFDDIVSVSGYDIEPFNFFLFVPAVTPPRSPIFDSIAALEVAWFPLTPGFMHYVYPTYLEGTLAVELNSGGNGNQSVQVRTLGTVGLVANQHSAGRANRDGIGAVVRFTPEGGVTVARPVSGGASYASQDSLTLTFGLGTTAKGTVEVLWPGGVRNRLYDVAAGENVTVPEIPCDYADFQSGLPANANASAHRQAYGKCVKESLKDLVTAGTIGQAFAARLEASALLAYDESH